MRIQIVPDTTLDNKNTDSLINNIYHYRTPLQRFEKHPKAIRIDGQFTTAYEIELSALGPKFFINYDDRMDTSLKTELNIAFPKSTIRQNSDILSLRNPIISQLDYKYHHFLSLRIERRGIGPLPHILETLKLIQSNDKVLIQVILSPENPDTYTSIEEAIKEFSKGHVVKRLELTAKNIFNSLLKAGIYTLQEILSIVSFFLSDKEMEFESIDSSEYQELLRRGLSTNTNNKSKWNMFNTQIRVVVESKDTIRKESIMRSIVTAFKGMDEDNKLIEHRVKNVVKYLPCIVNRSIPFSLNKNIMSSAELGQIIQLPTKSYQELYKMESIDTREVEIPTALTKGTIQIGSTSHRGTYNAVYWPNDKNILALPKVLLGAMNSGKTEYTKRFCVEAAKKGDTVIVFDYIKRCELSNDISKVVKNCIIIDLSKEENIIALAYPELQATGTPWERMKIANILSRQVEYLLNSLSPEPLTPKMSRYLDAACKVVFIHQDAKLNDVINVLLNWQIRNEFIRKSKYSECFSEDDTELLDLDNLHERDTENKIVGTRENKIEGIIDRISIMRKDLYLRSMLKAPIDYSINFSNWMDEGKTILIQMPENVFTAKMIKDTICTYFMSRVWLSALQRKNHNRICHIITDEIHQVPTCAQLISGVITEGRKFGVSFYFTAHYWKQFKTLHDGIRSAGSSIMLLAGTERDNLTALSEELYPFTIQDGLSLKPFHSLNVINYGNQFAKFISKLPPLIRAVT